MKLALFKNVKYGYAEHVLPADFGNDEYVRISEIIDVEFPALPYGEAESMEIAIIDKQISKVNADAGSAIAKLEQRKAELLALPSASTQGERDD